MWQSEGSMRWLVGPGVAARVLPRPGLPSRYVAQFGSSRRPAQVQVRAEAVPGEPVGAGDQDPWQRAHCTPSAHNSLELAVLLGLPTFTCWSVPALPDGRACR